MFWTEVSEKSKIHILCLVYFSYKLCVCLKSGGNDNKLGRIVMPCIHFLTSCWYKFLLYNTGIPGCSCDPGIPNSWKFVERILAKPGCQQWWWMWRGEVFVQVCLGFAILCTYKNISPLNLALVVQSTTQFMFLLNFILSSPCIFTLFFEKQPTNAH